MKAHTQKNTLLQAAQATRKPKLANECEDFLFEIVS